MRACSASDFSGSLGCGTGIRTFDMPFMRSRLTLPLDTCLAFSAIVDVVQEHVHPSQVVGRVVDLLAEEALVNDVGVKVLF